MGTSEIERLAEKREGPEEMGRDLGERDTQNETWGKKSPGKSDLGKKECERSEEEEDLRKRERL